MKKLLYFVMLFAAIHAGACGNRNQNQAAATQVSEQSKSSPDNNDLLVALQGKWRSETDSTYVLEISDDTLRHINNGKLSVETSIEVDGACVNTACQGSDAADGWCFLEKGQFDIQCHLVLKCNENELKYTAIGAASGQLSFKKDR